MVLADVYQGLGNVPRGSIKELRIVQIFPKTTHVANSPPIGMAAEENGRAILGTVPVEPDGSARFTVPAQRPILFQALDADGMAWQTMRSVTYVQPGERVACVGCHEGRMTAPVRPASAAAAIGRGASPIDPGPLGGRPFSFVEMVQPVLDRHCVRCHGGEKTEGKIDLTRTVAGSYTRSYAALCGDRNFWAAGTNPVNAAEALVPRYGARNQIQVSPPGGMYGSRGSRLLKLPAKGHYDVRLARDDVQRLAAWIDLNAIFYGVNNPEDQARQLRGEPVAMPEIQ
jgi:cytochrome c553